MPQASLQHPEGVGAHRQDRGGRGGTDCAGGGTERYSEQIAIERRGVGSSRQRDRGRRDEGVGDKRREGMETERNRGMERGSKVALALVKTNGIGLRTNM